MRVAIVGCGPKGLFALERLLAHASVPGALRSIDLCIDVFEPHPATGAGPNYDPAQPGYLRMNFAASQIDMWWRGDGPQTSATRPDFEAWRGADDDPYPARAEVGRYLNDGWKALLAAVPEGVHLELHRRSISRISRGSEGDWLLTVDGDLESRFDEVMITNGHRRTWSGALGRGGTPSGEAGLISAVFPVADRLGPEHVPAGSTVAIRGFGLTFIDAALTLTEGRGGEFVTDSSRAGFLEYTGAPDAVGLIQPHSRSGRPMLAKPDPRMAALTPELDRIGAEGRERLIALQTPVTSLSDQILPVIAAVARQIMSHSRAAFSPSSMPEPIEIFRWLELASAGALPESADPREEIRRSVQIGGGAEPADPSWSLGAAWRAVYPALVATLGSDGLADPQWPAFRRLSAEMERLAFGPPPINARKLLALIDADIVDLSRPTPLEPAVDVIIDAVLAPAGASDPDPDGGLGPLDSLLREGHVSVHGGRRGLAVNDACQCLRPDGEPSPGLSAFGRPTEDWIIGNDTLSRDLHPQVDRWANLLVTAGVSA